jgi:TRAP-type C4-dicarboxylate transport system substrate-binding protein
MNLKKFVLPAVAIVLAFTCSSIEAQSRITLKIASVAPSRSPWDIEQRALAQEWSTITKGQVAVTFFDVGSLGGEKGVIQKFRSVRPGQKAPLDGMIFSTIGLHELAPAASIYTLSLPFLIRNQKELDLVLDTYADKLRAEYRKEGFELLTWTNVGWLSFYTKDKFSTIAELKKIKIASAGLESPVLGDAFRAAGFTIEDMSSTKLIQEIKGNGGVRGFFGVHMYAYVTGLSKSVNYALDAKLSPIMAGLAISNESWAKIPAEYKPAMIDAVIRMKTRLDAALDASDRNYVESMKKEGVTMIEPTKAELSSWESVFMKDMAKIEKTVPGTFDRAFYTDIQKLLATARK